MTRVKAFYVLIMTIYLSRHYLSLEGHEVNDLGNICILQTTDFGYCLRCDFSTRRFTTQERYDGKVITITPLSKNLKRNLIDPTKSKLKVENNIIWRRNKWIPQNKLKFFLRVICLNMYSTVGKGIKKLLPEVHYLSKVIYSSRITLPLPQVFLLVLLILISINVYNSVKQDIRAHLDIKLSLQYGTSKKSIYFPKLSKYNQGDITKVYKDRFTCAKGLKTLDSRNLHTGIEKPCLNQSGGSYIVTYKPLTYLVYPVSTVNLLASYRPLVYTEMPNSIFFITLSSNGFYYPERGVSVICIGCENVVELLRFVSDPSSAIYHKRCCEFIKDVEREQPNSLPAQTGYFNHETQIHNSNHEPRNDSENNTILTSLPSNSHSTPPAALLTSGPAISTLTLSPPTSGAAISTQTLSLPTPGAAISTLSLSPPTLGPPAYPVFSSTDKRTESFIGWTKNSIVASTALVQAGFFYAGYSDCVRCFQCGLGLRSWKPGDDIYVEHKRFRPACEFLQTLLRNKPQGRADNVPLTETRVNSNNEQIRLGSNITDNGANERSNNSSNNSMPSRVASIVSINNDQSANNMAHSNERSQEEHHQNAISSSLEHENNQISTSSPPESRSNSNVVANLLQRENQVLKDQMKCKSCKVSHVQDLFLPCGEMYTCKDCSNKFTHCPSCGKRILGTVTVFFA